MNLNDHIRYSIRAHQFHPKTLQNSFRLWDKKTPYFIHPLWCAMTILTETALPPAIRRYGAITLLYHDVLEDTTMKLPPGIPHAIRAYINDMTFYGGITEEMLMIWRKQPTIRLFKLYDKVSNLLDASWMPAKLRKTYTAYTKKLALDVKNNFGTLNITAIAQTVFMPA
ncbi:hypothetical protein HY949_02650 [Candidatus Gottesmanbacteria bacterium]|nr:hypothetical protein [Candidatus Gottesmanbacteria bacterium]